MGLATYGSTPFDFFPNGRTVNELLLTSGMRVAVTASTTTRSLPSGRYEKNGED